MVFSLFPSLLQDFPPGQEISRDPGAGEAKQELKVRTGTRLDLFRSGF